MNEIETLINQLRAINEQEGRELDKLAAEIIEWLFDGHKLSEYEFEKEFNERVKEYVFWKTRIKYLGVRFHCLKHGISYN